MCYSAEQLSFFLKTNVPPKRDNEVHIAWMTITYRSVFVSVFVLIIALTTGTYFLFPHSWFSGLINKGIDKVANSSQIHDDSNKPVGPESAHFTNIDGTVKVKQNRTGVWVTAGYDLQLERGDVVKTDSQGIAKIVFADRSTYTVKEDSLIVIEENSTNSNSATNVAVTVTTGTIDLQTATQTPGSKAQIKMAGSQTDVKSDTTLEASYDPNKGKSEVLVQTGNATLKTQTGEIVPIAPYERVTYNPESNQIAKVKEIAPPTLIEPGNLAPIFSSGGRSNVAFSWAPVDQARSYRIRVSKNQYFTQASMVMDRRISTSELKLGGFQEGAYYWAVQSIDGNGKESIESVKNKFNVVPKGTEVNLALELETPIQHGHRIEVIGKTDPGAVVLVNGQSVPLVDQDGVFHFFTPEFPNGENLVTVTAQNAKGGVATKTTKVVIQ